MQAELLEAVESELWDLDKSSNYTSRAAPNLIKRHPPKDVIKTATIEQIDIYASQSARARYRMHEQKEQKLW